MKKQPTIKEIEKAVRNCLTVDVPEDDIQSLTDKIDEFCDDSCEAGFEDGQETGAKEAIEDYEIPDTEKERIGSDYVVEKFADCKTLADFQDAYKWVEITHLNYMGV